MCLTLHFPLLTVTVLSIIFAHPEAMVWHGNFRSKLDLLQLPPFKSPFLAVKLDLERPTDIPTVFYLGISNQTQWTSSHTLDYIVTLNINNTERIEAITKRVTQFNMTTSKTTEIQILNDPYLNTTIFSRPNQRIWRMTLYFNSYIFDGPLMLLNNFDSTLHFRYGSHSISPSPSWNTWTNISTNFTIFHEYEDKITMYPAISIWRGEEYVPVLWVFALLFYILCGILCLVFRNKQPLRSRGAIPLLGCIFQFLALFPGLGSFFVITDFEKEKISPILYIVWIYWRNPLISLIIFLSVWHFIRYIILFNLNERKLLFDTNVGNGEKFAGMKWYFRILKIMGKRILTVITSIALYLVLICYYSFMWFSFDDWFVFAVILLLIATAVTGSAFDIIINFQNLRKDGLYSFFWKKDALFFRVEIYVLMIIVTAIPAIVLYVIIRTILIDPNIVDDSVYRTYLHTVNTVMMFSIFALQVLFSLSITIFYVIRKRFGTSPSEMSVTFTDEELMNLFTKFAQDELSVENVQCWKDIQQFKRNPSLEFAQYIYLLYLNGSQSELEVNVRSVDTNEVYRKIGTDQVDCTLFDDIEKTIRSNLYDTFSRFEISAQYRTYKRQQSIIKK